MNVVGRTIRQPGFGGRPTKTIEIVGLVEDAVYRSLRDPVPPTIYLPIAQHDEPPPFVSVSVRAESGSPAALSKSVASELMKVHSDLALTFRPLAEQVNAALTQERVVAMLSAFFGGLALLLAGMGLYGITAYAVSRRRTEIGIRLALGSDSRGIVRLVLSRVALLVGIGVMAGGAVSFWAARYVATLLFQLEPRDPRTFIAVVNVRTLLRCDRLPLGIDAHHEHAIAIEPEIQVGSAPIAPG